jgi:hypothetical protein
MHWSKALQKWHHTFGEIGVFGLFVINQFCIHHHPSDSSIAIQKMLSLTDQKC